MEEFRKILADRAVELSRLTEPQAAASLSPGQWSPKEILGHLLDSAANNHHRFVLAQFQDSVSLPAYAQERWVAAQHYRDRPWNELVAFWIGYNQHLLHLMESTPPDRLRVLCRVGENDPVTLEFLMLDYIRHLEHHLSQIFRRAQPTAIRPSA